MNNLFKPGVISKEKKAASSREIAAKFRWPPAPIENAGFSRQNDWTHFSDVISHGNQ